MPYRDELEALRRRVEIVEAEREELAGRLARAGAALASVVAAHAGLPAEADIPWRSLHGGEPKEVTFVNRSGGKIVLLWLDYQGRLREELTLVDGGRQVARTHTGHLWRMTDEVGAVIWQGYVRASDDEIVAP